MKKIIAILLMVVLIATSATAVNIQQRNEDIDADESTGFNDYKFGTKVKKSCEVKYVDGYPVSNFPPKTPEQLALIDPDPMPTMSFDDLPSQFSWKSYGGDWTTPARDQGNCGSCWDFSALGAMEAAINIASGNPSTNIDLSEQYVLSCLGAAGSCSGGWMSTAIEYIQSTSSGSTGNGINGVCVESCMPYQAVDYIPCDSKCSDWDTYSEPPQSSDKLFQILNYGVTTTNEDSPSDWNLLKTMIMTYGPLSVDIVASGFGSWGSSHHSPNDVYENDVNGITDHGVLLVGWVDDDTIMNGGYWIIKNSWGSSWGYGGFGNIAYGCNGVATRDCVWVLTPAWPSGGDDDGPIDVDIAVFSNFEYETAEDNIKYAHVGDEIDFWDTSDGDVSSREWDFNSDGVVDSTNKRPTWTYNQEGDYEVTLTVRNAWGIESNRTRIVGVYEIWPPIAKIKPDKYPDPDHPNNDLEIHFDARESYDPDNGQIIDYQWDFGDGTTGDGRSLVHTFPEADKIYDVTLTLTDNDGGTTTATREIKIDQTVPPETQIHHGFGNDGSTWYSETERISFSATDWTKVIFTYYRVDDGEWTRYIIEEQQYIPVGSEGMHTVEAYSIDYYNNEEIPVKDTFGIDKTDPSLDISLNGNMQGGQYIEPVTVTLSGEDDLSGLDKVEYKVLGMSDWKEYTSSFEIDDQCYLKCKATDKAGNFYEETIEIPIEGPPTALKISGPRSAAPGKELNYIFEATDFSPSPDNNIKFKIDWGDGDIGDWTDEYYDSGEEVVFSHVFNSQGNYEIKFKAKDTLGAESDWSDGFVVSMPKSRSYDFPLLRQIIDAFPLLQELFRLFEVY